MSSVIGRGRTATLELDDEAVIRDHVGIGHEQTVGMACRWIVVSVALMRRVRESERER